MLQWIFNVLCTWIFLNRHFYLILLYNAWCCTLVKADSQDWNSVSSFDVKTILLRHFACGKILSIVTNVKIATNVGRVVGTRLKKYTFFLMLLLPLDYQSSLFDEEITCNSKSSIVLIILGALSLIWTASWHIFQSTASLHHHCPCTEGSLVWVAWAVL